MLREGRENISQNSSSFWSWSTLGALEQYEAATRLPEADLRRQRCKMTLSVKYCGEHLKVCPAKSVSFTGIYFWVFTQFTCRYIHRLFHGHIGSLVRFVVVVVRLFVYFTL